MKIHGTGGSVATAKMLSKAAKAVTLDP